MRAWARTESGSSDSCLSSLVIRVIVLVISWSCDECHCVCLYLVRRYKCVSHMQILIRSVILHVMMKTVRNNAKIKLNNI
jgi:hypothetical protein